MFLRQFRAKLKVFCRQFRQSKGMAVPLLLLLAPAAAAGWCAGAAAWTPWAKQSPPGPQVSRKRTLCRTFAKLLRKGPRDRRLQLPWIAVSACELLLRRGLSDPPQNFDDQSVDSIPSSTRDLEYTKARKAAPFYPESAAPVVAVEPQQERFAGLHAAEVGLSRCVTTVTTG